MRGTNIMTPFWAKKFAPQVVAFCFSFEAVADVDTKWRNNENQRRSVRVILIMRY
jgi:hypothetical protein